MRSFATTAVLAGALALTGATAAHAASDPDPTTGVASNSPGLLSGDVIQVPIDIPINLSGTSVDLLGLLNPASGNTCSSS
jgi:hypothetical protein